MLFDAPASPTAPPGSGGPGASWMLRFFPMQEGTRNVMKIKMAPGKYFNLLYHWGWRKHPPRVQAIENVNKIYEGKTLYQWESGVFGVAPRSSRQAQLAAIGMLGAMAPERSCGGYDDCPAVVGPETGDAVDERCAASYNDWTDRTHLPRGFTADPTTDVTLVYANKHDLWQCARLQQVDLAPAGIQRDVVNPTTSGTTINTGFRRSARLGESIPVTRGELPNPDALGAGASLRSDVTTGL